MRITFPYDGYEHLGIGYLAAIAIERGHAVTLAPLNLGDYIRGRKPMDERGLALALSAIMKTEPDAVAFSLNSYMAEDHARIASRVRKEGVVTLAGGPHAAAEPQLTMQTGAFDGLIAHEAEAVFLEALEYLRHKTGVTPPWLFTPDSCNAASVSRPQLPDLDALPFPAKELFYQTTPFEADDYKIITSRGCPYRCIFCAHSGLADAPPFRRRGIGPIIDELAWAKRKFRPSSVYFLDDVFTLNAAWLGEFLRDYKRTIALPFHAISHPSCFTDEVAAMLKHAGCFKIRLGVQSLTPRIKQYLGRAETNERVIQAIAAAKRHGISLEVDHLVNVPGESLEEGREGVRLYNRHRPDAIKVYWLIPLPGTRLFAEAQKTGMLTETDADEIRRGKGFGTHSYLFYGRRGYYDRRWLGIHFLLSFLTLLPRSLVSLLLDLRADRFMRIPSFTLMVGVPRIFTIFNGRDLVGRDHVRRLLRMHPFKKNHPPDASLKDER